MVLTVTGYKVPAPPDASDQWQIAPPSQVLQALTCLQTPGLLLFYFLGTLLLCYLS